MVRSRWLAQARRHPWKRRTPRRRKYPGRRPGLIRRADQLRSCAILVGRDNMGCGAGRFCTHALLSQLPLTSSNSNFAVVREYGRSTRLRGICCVVSPTVETLNAAVLPFRGAYRGVYYYARSSFFPSFVKTRVRGKLQVFRTASFVICAIATTAFAGPTPAGAAILTYGAVLNGAAEAPPTPHREPAPQVSSSIPF